MRAREMVRVCEGYLDEENICPGFGEGDGHGLSDAPRAARYEGCLARQGEELLDARHGGGGGGGGGVAGEKSVRNGCERVCGRAKCSAEDGDKCEAPSDGSERLVKGLHSCTEAIAACGTFSTAQDVDCCACSSELARKAANPTTLGI
jgi:hypothetical protein